MIKNKVSVIISTYNRASFLKQAIDSVLNQTYSDFELIIVDDGSTDNTQKVVESYNDPRIIYIYQENAGQNAAKNKGLMNVSGEYVSILDSDDMWHPEKLDRQVNILKNMPEVGLVYCGTMLIDENNNVIGKQPHLKYNGNVLDKLLLKNFIYNGSNALFRTECLEKTGLFDESVQRMTDWDLYLRIALFYNFYALDDFLLYYRVHGENMSCGFEKYEIAGFTILDRIFSHKNLDEKYLKLKDKAYAYRYKYMARRYFEANQYLKSREYILKSIESYPLIALNKEILELSLSFILPQKTIQQLRSVKKYIKTHMRNFLATEMEDK